MVNESLAGVSPRWGGAALGIGIGASGAEMESSSSAPLVYCYGNFRKSLQGLKWISCDDENGMFQDVSIFFYAF